MKYLFLSLFLCSTFYLSGQDKSIKVYSNFLYLNSERYSILFNPNKKGFEFEQVSLAYRKRNEKTFFELEGGLLTFKEELPDFAKDHFDIHIRGEQGFKMRESANGKFLFYISLAAKIYYWREDDLPKTSANFETNTWSTGLNGALFLRGEYHFNEKFYLDVNTTFLGGTLSAQFSTLKDPILTVNQQTQGGFDFDILSERLLRIGIGYKFGMKT